MINPSNPTRPPGITGSPLIGKLWAIIEGEPGQGYDRSERASLTHGEIRALLLELDAAKTDAVPDVKPEMPDLLARSSRTNSNAERRTVSPDDIVAKIDAMLDSMTSRPGLWGPLPCVEMQALRLLEVRALVAGSDERDSEIVGAYRSFLATAFPGSDPVSLRTRVASSGGDEGDFCRWLRDFVAAERDRQRTVPTTTDAEPIRNGLDIRDEHARADKLGIDLSVWADDAWVEKHDGVLKAVRPFLSPSGLSRGGSIARVILAFKRLQLRTIEDWLASGVRSLPIDHAARVRAQVEREIAESLPPDLTARVLAGNYPRVGVKEWNPDSVATTTAVFPTPVPLDPTQPAPLHCVDEWDQGWQGFVCPTENSIQRDVEPPYFETRELAIAWTHQNYQELLRPVVVDFITRLRSWWESRADEDQECDAWKWEQALLAASGHGSIP